MVFVFLCVTYVSQYGNLYIHPVAANGIILFSFFMAEWDSVVYMYYIFLIHSSTDRQKLSLNLCLLLKILSTFTFSQMGLKSIASSNVAHSWFSRLLLSIPLINMQTFFVRSSLLCKSTQVQPTTTNTHYQHF